LKHALPITENIHCLALNYRGVGDNSQDPLYFVKSLNAMCFSNSHVEYPQLSNQFWTEPELAVFISEECYNVEASAVMEVILGVTLGADLTCQNVHHRDHHLAFSKSRKNFCPVVEEYLSPTILDQSSEFVLRTFINGKLTQEGNTKDMKYNLLESISYISRITELKRGDLILTGTPAGVENNILQRGDRVLHTLDDKLELRFEVV